MKIKTIFILAILSYQVLKSQNLYLNKYTKDSDLIKSYYIDCKYYDSTFTNEIRNNLSKFNLYQRLDSGIDYKYFHLLSNYFNDYIVPDNYFNNAKTIFSFEGNFKDSFNKEFITIKYFVFSFKDSTTPNQIERKFLSKNLKYLKSKGHRYIHYRKFKKYFAIIVYDNIKYSNQVFYILDNVVDNY